MGRPAKAFYSARYRCWVTSALGEVRVTKGGRTYRPLTLFKDLTHPSRDELAAQARLHRELEKLAAAVVLGDDITFAQLTEFYLEDAEKSGRLGPEAYDRAVEHLERFGNWPSPDDPARMDALPCRRIGAEDVEAFVAAMAATRKMRKDPKTDEMVPGDMLSESYITEGLLKTIKAVFSWACEVRAGRYAGLPLESNPVKGVKGPQVRRRAVREESPENVARLILWAMRRARRMRGLKRRFARISTILLLCLKETGARPKELCSATWDDWSPEADGWSTIGLDVWKNSKKTSQRRTIALPPSCTRRIAWIARQPGRHPTHIFTHRRPRGSVASGTGSPEAGEPWVIDPAKRGSTKSLQKWFFRLRKEAIDAGVPISPDFRLYWNRSMFSTQAQRRGVPRALLAKALGTSESMLDRSYTDLHKADVLDVAKAARASAAPPPPADAVRPRGLRGGDDRGR